MPVFSVPKQSHGSRLDQFLSAEVSTLSRSRIQNLIRAGHVLVNDQRGRPSLRVKADDVVTLREPPPEPVETAAEEMALSILFEDDLLIVIDKPAGMVVHPAAGHRRGTLVNALLHHCAALSSIGGEQRPGIVHRLDKETSGCLVVAKSDQAHEALSRQFAQRKVLKVYLALLKGRPKEKGVVETAIGRHPVDRKKMAVVPESRGRASKTSYRVLQEVGGASLVECTLHTGRTHQIRVHMKHLGHPVLGDKVYGGAGGFNRQMLHAWKLGFFHPGSGEWMQFQSPIPPDFAEAGVRLP